MHLRTTTTSCSSCIVNSYLYLYQLQQTLTLDLRKLGTGACAFWQQPLAHQPPPYFQLGKNSLLFRLHDWSDGLRSTSTALLDPPLGLDKDEVVLLGDDEKGMRAGSCLDDCLHRRDTVQYRSRLTSVRLSRTLTFAPITAVTVTSLLGRNVDFSAQDQIEPSDC